MQKSMDSSIMQAAWNEISISYQARYRIGTEEYYYGPFCPNEDDLGLLGDVDGKRVLEIGSGAGQNSIYLAARGSIATAYDISVKQLEHGQRLAAAAGVAVQFIEGAFETLPGRFEAACYDLIVSSFAFQYHQSLASLHSTFAEMRRLLAPGGSVVISVDHPLKAIGSWNEDDNFVIVDYFDDETKEWDYSFPESATSARMTGRFFTISDYLDGICRAGMALQRVLEPKPVSAQSTTNNFGKQSRYGRLSEKDPFSYNHLSRIPGTLIFKAGV